MTRKSTITKRKETLELIEKSGLTINAYFKANEKNPSSFYQAMSTIIEDYENGQTELEDIVALYNRLKNREHLIEEEDSKQLELFPEETQEIQDTDDRVTATINRDSEGKIVSYSFKVYRRDNTPVEGTLTRDEMNDIYRLYSYYGASITQREISRRFPDYSLVDFKRILRAFNITKASGPFAPHMYEEKSEDELKELHLREKENDFLKRIEKDELNDIRQTAVKLARRNRELEQQLSDVSNIEVNLGDYKPIKVTQGQSSSTSLVLHLSDLHIGAKCESNTLYPNPWNKEELERRLNEVLNRVSGFGHLNTLVINLLGDNLDGMDNQTARRDHLMPQNMDNLEQVNVFMEVMTRFILDCRELSNNVIVYSVKDGNHDGISGYIATLALKNIISKLAPEVEFTLFKDFIGKYEFKGHTYCICHGKDDKFMKKGLPLNLDEKSKVMIYEWLSANNITGDNIHFIKGDLHSNALSSCMKFDYRNVLSLFGASDYSNYNFSRNSYGVSFDLFVGNTRTIGTFENV